MPTEILVDDETLLQNGLHQRDMTAVLDWTVTDRQITFFRETYADCPKVQTALSEIELSRAVGQSRVRLVPRAGTLYTRQVG
jgi:hypothetical protein